MLSFEQFKACFYAQNWVRLFIKRYEEQHNSDEELETSLRELYDTDDCCRAVDYLITWSATAEGSSYWRSIHDKFFEYVRNYSQE